MILAIHRIASEGIKICPQQVFAYQAPGQMVIEVLDFASTIRPEKLKQRVGQGHPGSFYDFEKNDFDSIKGLSRLHDWLEACLREAQQHICWNKDHFPELTMTQSWLNISGLGHDHDMHVHPLSILSGVLCLSHHIKINLYVQSIYSLPTFLCPDQSDSCLLIKQAIELESGDLLLFPSSLRHGVSCHEEEESRVTLSFNSFFTGTIGDASLLAMLNRSP